MDKIFPGWPHHLVGIFMGLQKVHTVTIEEINTFGDGRTVKNMRASTRYYLYTHPQPITKFDVVIARIALFMVKFTIGIIIAFGVLLAIIF